MYDPVAAMYLDLDFELEETLTSRRLDPRRRVAELQQVELKDVKEMFSKGGYTWKNPLGDYIKAQTVQMGLEEEEQGIVVSSRGLSWRWNLLLNPLREMGIKFYEPGDKVTAESVEEGQVVS